MVQRVVDGELTDISTLHSLADTATLKKVIVRKPLSSAFSYKSLARKL
jgi:hypothetical protein